MFSRVPCPLLYCLDLATLFVLWCVCVRIHEWGVMQFLFRTPQAHQANVDVLHAGCRELQPGVLAGRQVGLNP